MKKIFAALLVTVVASGAFATSMDRTAVIARADGNFEGMKTVALLADGRLQIVGHEGLIKQVYLSDKIFNKLTRDIQMVSNVETKTVRKDFVCMTLVAVIPTTLDRLSVARYDFETQSFGNKTRLILSERGCMYHVETFPAQEYLIAEAASLREALVVLGLANLD